jgi:hypothetical protein
MAANRGLAMDIYLDIIPRRAPDVRKTCARRAQDVRKNKKNKNTKQSEMNANANEKRKKNKNKK